jgi:prepilin-type N-terminal cleavage/methylation domain-containing protein
MTRRGVTLTELLLVLTLLGVMLAASVPRIASALDGAQLRQARSELLGALDASRGAAIRLGAPVLVSGNSGLVRVSTTDSATIWQRHLAPSTPLRLAGLETPIRFGPAGIAVGVANRTLRLAGRNDTLTVVLSRLGRIR